MTPSAIIKTGIPSRIYSSSVCGHVYNSGLCTALKLCTWFSYSSKCIDNRNNNFIADGIILDLRRLRVF